MDKYFVGQEFCKLIYLQIFYTLYISVYFFNIFYQYLGLYFFNIYITDNDINSKMFVIYDILGRGEKLLLQFGQRDCNIVNENIYS